MAFISCNLVGYGRITFKLLPMPPSDQIYLEKCPKMFEEVGVLLVDEGRIYRFFACKN